MWELIVNSLRRLRGHPKQAEFIDAVIYRRVHNISNVNDAVDIVLIASQNPVHHAGVRTPGGAYLSQRQYQKLPGHLRVFFAQENVRIRTGTQL